LQNNKISNLVGKIEKNAINQIYKKIIIYNKKDFFDKNILNKRNQISYYNCLFKVYAFFDFNNRF